MGFTSFLISLAAGLTLSATQKVYSGLEKIVIQRKLEKELSDKAFEKMLSSSTSVEEFLKQFIIKACKTLSFFDDSVDEIFCHDSSVLDEFVAIVAEWLIGDQNPECKVRLQELILKHCANRRIIKFAL